MFTQAKKMANKTIGRKLHSIHSLLKGREFTGEIEAGKAKHRFVFTPTSAAVVTGKLELSGRLTVKSAANQSHKADHVKATLLSTQGGLATAPAAPEDADVAMLGSITSVGLPVTDATGSRAYVGVMYFKLSPLNGPGLGLPFDLSAVQLNGRLHPEDGTARTLQFWYSVAVRAIYSQSPENALASRAVNEINKILGA
jgi:hypothetical protein